MVYMCNFFVSEIHAVVYSNLVNFKKNFFFFLNLEQFRLQYHFYVRKNTKKNNNYNRVPSPAGTGSHGLPCNLGPWHGPLKNKFIRVKNMQ